MSKTSSSTVSPEVERRQEAERVELERSMGPIGRKIVVLSGKSGVGKSNRRRDSGYSPCRRSFAEAVKTLLETDGGRK